MQVIDKRHQLGRILSELREYMNGMCCGLNDRDYEATTIHYAEAERHLKLLDEIREKARAAETKVQNGHIAQQTNAADGPSAHA